MTIAAILASESGVDRANEDAADHVTATHDATPATTVTEDAVTRATETISAAEADHMTVIPDADLAVDHVTAKDHVMMTAMTETASAHAMRNPPRK